MTSPKRGDVATGGMPLTIELHGACCKILFSFSHSKWFRYWFPYKHRQLCSWWFAMRRVYNVALINLLFHVPYKQSSQVINYMSSVICRFFYLKIHQKGLRWHNWWMRFFCWTFILPKRMPLRRKFIAVFVLGKCGYFMKGLGGIRGSHTLPLQNTWLVLLRFAHFYMYPWWELRPKKNISKSNSLISLGRMT